MVRVNRALLSAALLASLTGTALWARPAGARERASVNAIERSVARLARTPMARRELTVVSNRRFSLWIKPGARVIGVRRGLFSRKGFFLNASGRLSDRDRGELQRLLARHAPELTAKAVEQKVAGEVQRHEVHARELRKQDGTIDSLLRRAAGIGGKGGHVLWRKGRAALVYKPERDVLVGQEGFFGRRGFFLRRTAEGLEVRPEYLEDLREFLHRYR